MHYGVFYNNAPWIHVTMFWNGIVKPFWFIVDTGFTGGLQLPKSIADELGLPVIAVDKVKIANGAIIDTPVSNVVVNLNGKTIVTGVIISENGDPLLGIRFLKDMELVMTINPANNIVIFN